MASTEVIASSADPPALIVEGHKEETSPTETQPTTTTGSTESQPIKKEESTTPPTELSPSAQPISTNPSSPREPKQEEPAPKTEEIEDKNSIKMEKAESQPPPVATPAPKTGRGGRKARRTIFLYNDLPDKTEEAESKFEKMFKCTYTPKSLANSGQEEELMSCECRAEFDDSGTNHACSHGCINAETYVECIDRDSNCGGQCQNQKFQKQEYAPVSVIQTEMKGYGLRADKPLAAGQFIYEYIGEVINETQFRKRREQYGKEDIKHFYFMSIKVGEYIDATKRGCLARFCNHSCNPNCMVEKWVVGGKLRMGIFAKVNIQAGEELTFDYNVDRYGADPQKCFCGEDNCIGYIGGKTQTEASTKLPTLVLEALGLDDDDGWQTATAKKSRKKKDDDDDFVMTKKARVLQWKDVPKVMGTLMQESKRWIVVSLLDRIENSPDTRVLGRVLEMHGYKIFNKLLGLFKDEPTIVIHILNIMHKWPRITKNKISSSKIEGTVNDIAANSTDETARELATQLAGHWSELEMGYRIPRRQKEALDSPGVDDRREKHRQWRRSRSRSRTPEKAEPINIPTGPRNLKPTPTGPRRTFPKDAPKGPRNPHNFQRALPQGWKMFHNDTGKPYYFNEITNQTQWDRPTGTDNNGSNSNNHPHRSGSTPNSSHPSSGVPGAAAQRAAEKVVMSEQEQALQAIIQNVEQDLYEDMAARKRMQEMEAQKKLLKTKSTNGLMGSFDAGPQPRNPEDEKRQLHKLEKGLRDNYYPVLKELTKEWERKLGNAEWKNRCKEIAKICAAKDIKKRGIKAQSSLVVSPKERSGLKQFAWEFLRKVFRRQKETRQKKEEALAAKKATSTGKAGDPSATDLDGDTLVQNGDEEDDIPSAQSSPFEPEMEPEATIEENGGKAGSVSVSGSPKRKRSVTEGGHEDEGRASPKRSRVNETVVINTSIPPPPPGTPPRSTSPSPRENDDETTATPADITSGDVLAEQLQRSPKRKRAEPEEVVGGTAAITPADGDEDARPTKRPRSVSKSRSRSRSREAEERKGYGDVVRATA